MKWISLMVLCLFQSVSAATFSDLSFLYYKGQVSKTEKFFEPKMECPPDNGRPVSCLKAVTNLLPPSSSDDSYEIKAIVEMCKGNANGGCITSATKNMDKSDTDDMYEVKEIANHCSTLQSGVCVGVFAKYLSKSSMDDSHEVFDAIKKCAGISDDVADCAEFSCSKQSANNCDDSYEIVSALRACSGNF